MLSKYFFHDFHTFLSLLGLVLDKFYKQGRAGVGGGLEKDFSSLVLHIFDHLVEPNQQEQRPSLVIANF